MRPDIYFETSPLFERRWTGIPVVTAGLAGALRKRFGQKIQFFYGRHLLPAGLADAALACGHGTPLLQAWQQGGPGWEDLHHRQPTTGCAIFPSVKPQRGLFATEASLFHDLSTLLTPQFHHAANIRHHLASLLADRATNRVSFAVSQASADDLAAYFGDDGRTFVAHPGVTWPAGYAARAARSAPPFAGQPYVLVLGTREPRKNLACLFTALRAQPTLLDRARVVIAGKAGWMDRHESFDPRIIFTGYVSQFRKFCLLRHAVALIYPSLFEGFGLPVLESLSVGTPCVVSFSSALPEIGGALCRYFDPCSPQSLAAALAAMLESPRNAEDDAARAAAVAGYTWDAMAARMLLHLSEVGA